MIIPSQTSEYLILVTDNELVVHEKENNFGEVEYGCCSQSSKNISMKSVDQKITLVISSATLTNLTVPPSPSPGVWNWNFA